MCITKQPKPELPLDYGTLDAEGSVTLRVEFLADGKVGNIDIVSGLTTSLTGLALDAAKKIEFIPRKIDGTSGGIRKVIQYSYSWHGFWRVHRNRSVKYCLGRAGPE